MKIQSINPHDQSIVGELDVTSTKETKAIVEEAKQAFKTWRYTDINERVDYVKKYRVALKAKIEEFAKLISLEMGKPISEARDDIFFELKFVDYYIQNGAKALADEVVLDNKEGNFRITYEPYGVCGCIAPWNFPISMINSGVIPAIIAGNTVVAKPSEHTPLVQKRNIDMMNEAGLPEGVLSVINGGGEVGKVLVDSDIDLVWFTGSTAVGKEIYEKAGKKFIHALLEMGGSSPAIVFADVELENAIENLYWGRYLNCGQVCTAVKRLFIEEPFFDKFVDRYKKRLENVKVGDPLKEDTDIGPLVSQKQLANLESQVKDAVSKGAKIIIGGKKSVDKILSKGNYYEPTVLVDVKPSMRVLTEEVFGPVLSIVPFKTEEEAVELANATEYGLSAEVYTSDIEKGEKLAKLIDAGTVAINTDNFFKPECPFGGFKLSGMGKEYGEVGMREFTRMKLIAKAK